MHHLSILPGHTGAVKVQHMTSVTKGLWQLLKSCVLFAVPSCFEHFYHDTLSLR